MVVSLHQRGRNIVEGAPWLFFLDGEGEVGAGEGFVLQGEVPPLGVQGLEAVGEHGAPEDHAVCKLLRGDASAGRSLGVIA